MVVVSFEPFIRLIDEFFQGLAFVVSRDRFVQAPPDTFDWVFLRSIPGQEMDLNSMPSFLQIRLNRPGGMKFSVVADDVDFSVTPQPEMQIVQMIQKLHCVSLQAGWTYKESPCAPDMRTSHMVFAIVPWRDHFGLLTFLHPHASDLGIQIQVDFVLKDRYIMGSKVLQ